ncbi:PDR/VanB family oxidoreductase [Cryptosporangium sp. NPDC051539]|uniref:PDR/VanB family oxidoreductase n=1 Tax=Cryptosporangium sp. NPDC051539 TaxID=3363962 RepID=UPI0037B9437C
MIGGTLALRVADRSVPAAGVVALDLVLADGRPLPEWSPGAHIDLHLPNGLVRQYSLCGPAGDRSRWQIAVLREPSGRGGSACVHDDLAVGDVVPGGGPRNHFAYTPSARTLFVAGGIGITPLLPMIEAAEAAGSDWRLVYGGRSLAAMAFREQLRAHGDRVRLLPQDEQGLIPVREMLRAEPRGTEVYCCGPEGLLAAVEHHHEGRDPARLHVERFTPAERDPDAVDLAFTVVLARSGRSLPVAADRSILQTLEDAGVEVESSCEEGSCGTCETAVRGGRPDHRDSVLTPAEREAGDTMMVCVSRSLTAELVLDL